ncbi:MAG: alpha/beta hydrolase-fold protein [Devosia sp.]
MADQTDEHPSAERAPSPERADPIAGELVTETFDYDGGRRVTVYRPPHPPQAVVFCGDGQLFSHWGGYLEAADLPIMIVGAHRTDATDDMVRLGEYSPDIDPTRFAAHERFFVGGVTKWVRQRFDIAFPPDRTVVAGVSASAEFSLAMGLRHPDTYGVVFSASPGAGFRPPSPMPATLPRTYLTAGTLEPFFRENATRWAEALGDAGANVILTEPVGHHGDPFWQAEFLRMLAWAFGR